MFGSMNYNVEKQEDIMFDTKFKFGETEIIGIPCYFPKNSPLLSYYQKLSEAQKKLVEGIFTNNLDLVKNAVEEDKLDITKPLNVITSNYGPRSFSIVEFKDYTSPEIVDYLRQKYNDLMATNYKSARRFNSPIDKVLPYFESTNSKSSVQTLPAFDGVQNLPIEEDEIDKIDSPIVFKDTEVGDTEIIGFVKGQSLDKSVCEQFIRGILTGNLSMVKDAMSLKPISVLNTIAVVTSNKLQINFDPMVEAKNSKDSEILNYLLGFKNEELKHRQQVPFNFGNPPKLMQKQEDIMFKAPLKLGDMQILGVPCNWDETNPSAYIYLQTAKARSKLLEGICTNNLSLVKEAIEGKCANITQPLKVITSSKNTEIFFIGDIKDHTSPEIVDYLRTAFNTEMIAKFKASRFELRPGSALIPGTKSKVETLMLFDGVQNLPIEEDEIDKIDNPIIFKDTEVGDTEIVGFAKGQNLDLEACEKLIRGILTHDLDMIKDAVASGHISLMGTIAVITKDKIQINFDPIIEAKNTKNKAIIDYMLSTQRKQLNIGYMPYQ